MTSANPKSSTNPELQIDLSDAKAQLEDRISKGKRMASKRPNSLKETETHRQKHKSWDDYNKVLLDRIFTTRQIMMEYMGLHLDFANNAGSVSLDLHNPALNNSIARLESIVERLPLYVTRNNSSIPVTVSAVSCHSNSRDVFIVHGHDNELKHTVARYLTSLQLNPIILHEQASAGRTIIEKFEEHSNACFAVVLLTPDDQGRIAKHDSVLPLNKRARQNVIFEWGFFLAKLGRRNVCGLVGNDLELPSDMNGVLSVPVYEGSDWKIRLAQEMSAAGVDIDLNLVIPQQDK